MPGNVNSTTSYFDDLVIRSVSDVEFSGSYMHHPSMNKAGIFCPLLFLNDLQWEI